MYGFTVDGQVRAFPSLAEAALAKAEAAQEGHRVGELEELAVTKV